MTEKALATLRSVSLGRLTGVLVALVGVCVYFGTQEPIFFTWANWQNILRGQSVPLLLGIGTTLVVLTGGIDLSIASMTAASTMIFGLVVEAHAGWPVAALVAIGVGGAMGLLNGLLIGLVRIPFLVVTLGGLSIYQGIALLSTGGEAISLFPFKAFAPLQRLVNGTVGVVPTILFICAGTYLTAMLALRWSRAGRSLYAVGSNAEAARLVGIKVGAVLVSVYTLSGFCAGLAGVVSAGRLAAASPLLDPNLMLNVIAAVLIGGTSLTGGAGGLAGTIVGVVFLGVIQNGLSLGSISTFWQGTVSGLILVGAVSIGLVRDHARRSRRRRAHLYAATGSRA
jgi:ribose transport system permease protein